MKFSIFLALALAALPAVANRSLNAQPVPDEVGGLLTASTICVVNISADAIASPQGLLATDVFQPTLKMLGKFSRGQDILVTFDMQQPAVASSATMHVRNNGASLAEINAILKPHGLAPAVESGRFISVSLIPSDRRGPVSERLSSVPARLEALRSAFATAEGARVRIAILPPKHLWQIYREVVPTLPAALGGSKSSVLTDGMTWAGIGMDPSTLAIKAQVQSIDENAAVSFARALPTWLRIDVNQMRQAKSGNELIHSLSSDGSAPNRPSPPTLAEFKEFEPIVRAILQNIEIKTEGSQVHLSMSPKVDDRTGGDVAKELFERALAPINTRSKANRLKQLLLAIHNYESANRYFPPGPNARGENGQPTLSWRVHVLPYLGENALYDEFHLDEPWDSEHNKTLVSKMPDVYATPLSLLADTQAKIGHTRFLAPQSDKTFQGQSEAIGFGHITDGTSNTIGVVEVSDENAVPWTAPQDYVFDVEDPAKGLHVDVDGKINCAYLDGSTHRIEASLPPKTFRLLFEMNDGQIHQVP